MRLAPALKHVAAKGGVLKYSSARRNPAWLASRCASDLSSCAYADMKEDEDGFTIRGDWAGLGAKHITARYRLSDFFGVVITNRKNGATRSGNREFAFVEEARAGALNALVWATDLRRRPGRTPFARENPPCL
ncbi:hypothetical protein [Rhizobium leguminosarum]|uniref:hypothetical protein n=1 Tax=Rhizobium leguminosarum TaxID=384 RepID=UPI003D02224A